MSLRAIIIVVLTFAMLAACGGGGPAAGSPAGGSPSPSALATASPAEPASPAATEEATDEATESPDDESPEGTAEGEAPRVRIFDFGYAPAELTVAAGTQIRWTNTGDAPHTVTFDDGPDSGTMEKGDRFMHTFDAAGTYSYLCELHPDMTATVTVTE